MKTSLQGILAIIAEEAIVLSTYRDKKGVPTIGIGHTAAAGPPTPMPGAKITIEDAIRIFAADLAKFERHVDSAIKRPLKQHEHDALVGFDFNTGAIESGTVDDKLNAGGIAAAMATLQQYEKSGGQYVKGLDLRRDREEAMFTRGIYPAVTHVVVYDHYPGVRRLVPVSQLDLSALGAAAPTPPVTQPDDPGIEDMPAPAPKTSSATLAKLIGALLLAAIGGLIAFVTGNLGAN